MKPESTFQNICRDFVQNEVEFNANDIIEGLDEDEKLEAYDAPPDYVEAAEQNDATLIEHMGEWAALDEKQAKAFKRLKRSDAKSAWLLDNVSPHDTKEEAAEAFCDENNIDVFEYRPEIYEFWSVSGWLGEKLKSAGEHVFDYFNHTIWGRCTTGQAILLDGVIRGIVKRTRLPNAIEEGKRAKEWLAQYEMAKPILEATQSDELAGGQNDAIKAMLTSLSIMVSEKARIAEQAELETLLNGKGE